MLIQMMQILKMLKFWIFLNSERHFKDTESVIKNKLISLFSELRGFKVVTTLVLEFKKIENDNETKYSTFYLNSKADLYSKAEKVISGNDI